MRKKRIGGLAVIPSREETAPQVINSIVYQLDLLHVTLNGFASFPEWAFREEYSSKCLFHLRHKDEKGDAMKFYGANEENVYYFTFDDDLIYPMGYCDMLAYKIEKLKGVVSLHGRAYPIPVESFRKWTENYRCLGTVVGDHEVNMIGTGCSAFDTTMIKICPDSFTYKNMADVQFSKMCFDAGVKMYVIGHDKEDLEYLGYKDTIWRSKADKSKETEILKSYLK